MKPKIAYNNVYFCGECYFSNDLKFFLQEKIDASINNISVGSGSTDIFLTTLKYKKYFDPGIFLLGGSIHDKWGWNNGETLKDVVCWFKTSLYESSLVVCLTGPFDKTTDKEYDHRITNEQKINMTKTLGLPCLDLRIHKENLSDHIHLNQSGKEIFYNKILNFLLTYKPNIHNPQINSVQQFTNQINVPSCKRFTIIHDHNNDILNIYNNEKSVKNLVPYRLLKDNPNFIPYIDRTLYNNFINPQVGIITFSQPVFIHATLAYY